MADSRKKKIEYYLNIAKEVASRSTCIRRKYGAIIVKDDEVIATGYNGAPRGCANCNELGACKREELNVPPGERYELCRSVHAEQNAMLSASRRDMKGTVMYLAGVDAKTNLSLKSAMPCSMCKRLLLNSGITRVIMWTVDDKGANTYESLEVTALKLDNDL